MKFSRKSSRKTHRKLNKKTLTHKKGGEKEVPPTPQKPYPYVSRLSEEQYKEQKEYEDYDAEPIDLTDYDYIPEGDDIPEGYGTITKKKGQLGGSKRKSSKRKSSKRKSSKRKSSKRKSSKRKSSKRKSSKRKSSKNKQ
jgi:hypothetical protein